MSVLEEYGRPFSTVSYSTHPHIEAQVGQTEIDLTIVFQMGHNAAALAAFDQVVAHVRSQLSDVPADRPESGDPS